MPNPTPIYRVNFNGTNIPGYVQSVDMPLSPRYATSSPIGSDNFLSIRTGMDPRKIVITVAILTSLGSSSSGLDHLNDCLSQYRSALAILSRQTSLAPLMIGDTDRYYEARLDNVTAPLEAGRSRKIVYSMEFTAQPFALGVTPLTTTFSSTGTASITSIPGRQTYPTITIASGVTALSAHDGQGHTLTFTRGSFTGDVIVDCAKLTVVTAGGVNAISTLSALNFGLVSSGGTMSVIVTSLSGSGTNTVSLRPRYEL